MFFIGDLYHFQVVYNAYNPCNILSFNGIFFFFTLALFLGNQNPDPDYPGPHYPLRGLSAITPSSLISIINT